VFSCCFTAYGVSNDTAPRTVFRRFSVPALPDRSSTPVSWGKSTDGAQQGPAANGDPDPTGRGHYDPETGLSDWYEAEGRRVQGEGKQWSQILKHWDLIEVDLHQWYGVDIGDGILVRRTWRWLEHRIQGLLAIEKSRLRLTLYPPKDQKKPRGKR